ncbi:MAG TPA: RsmD family RNA methyltransferase [Candidatus Limnocylindrales bacterium]|nr:RsmD family RNA methyltransferase [Candidatus Limnocylindrales bacterium]
MAPIERPGDDYELLDAGAGRRLERFGDHLVDRPHPAAIVSPEAPELWRDADLTFDRDRGWTGPGTPAEGWAISLAGLTLELRATESGGVGLFPEHLANVPGVVARIRERARGASTPAVLNLFAHTGLLTLAAARAGAAVTHVDASRTAVAWARRNAELTGLVEAPVRWLVDDALTFVRREARRGRRYDGILLDPPSYGHGGRRPWRLEADLPELLEACVDVSADDAFVLLTAHTAGYDDDRLAGEIRHAFRERGRLALEVRPMELHANSGARLSLGTAIRLSA